MPPRAVPALRIRVLTDAPVDGAGRFVLYWMIAHRRVVWNFALDRALEWVRELGRPLLILEPLQVDYPWASDRLHRFVLDGMADTAKQLAGTGVTYYPYVEPARGAGKGLLRALACHAAVCVTDDFPAFMLPSMVGYTSRRWTRTGSCRSAPPPRRSRRRTASGASSSGTFLATWRICRARLP
jgi:deoxyribodipyrimidine photo-lyase